MKGVILAGGDGSRLDPLTRITNKHLLPVYDRPMVYFAIEQLVGAGIDRIMIVTGGNHAGEFLRLLGNGSAFGLRHLDYTYQERVGGIAEALGLCEWFAAGDPIAVFLADNVFEHSVAPIVERFRTDPTGARLVLTEVEDPTAYGVVEMRDEVVVRIHEKPAMPTSNLAVAGFYLYDGMVFDIIRTLKPSGRGALELEDVDNRYVELGKAAFERVPGYWADCGESIQSLYRASTLVAQRGANKPWP